MKIYNERIPLAEYGVSVLMADVSPDEVCINTEHATSGRVEEFICCLEHKGIKQIYDAMAGLRAERRKDKDKE